MVGLRDNHFLLDGHLSSHFDNVTSGGYTDQLESLNRVPEEEKPFIKVTQKNRMLLPLTGIQKQISGFSNDRVYQIERRRLALVVRSRSSFRIIARYILGTIWHFLEKTSF